MVNLMKRLWLVLLLAMMSVFAAAQESWLIIMMAGQRIGYVRSEVTDLPNASNAAKRSVSETVMNAGLMGAAMSIEIKSDSTLTADGKLIDTTYSITSAGRTQTVVATYGATTISVKVVNNGAETSKDLPIPAGAEVMDDPVNAIVAGNFPVGTSKAIYVLDPLTASLVKNTVTLKGPTEVEVKGKKTTATLVEISEPRATLRAFLTSKNELLKMEGPAGMEMYPATKEEALAKTSDTQRPDLADITSIRPDKPIPAIGGVKALKLRVSGRDLQLVPSDTHQTVKKDGNSWIVEVHPVKPDAKTSLTIAAAKKLKPEWAKPSMNIPSNTETFVKLSKSIVGNRQNVIEAAQAIRLHVLSIMRPNAGIGVLRDASEVLKTKEGVCRDYATLTAALMRAAGIPTRMVSGLVFQDGQFFYHAWVEVFDGKRWIGMDSTRPAAGLTAGHIKLAHGSVEDAFTFPFLDKAKIEVLGITR